MTIQWFSFWLAPSHAAFSAFDSILKFFQLSRKILDLAGFDISCLLVGGMFHGQVLDHTRVLKLETLKSQTELVSELVMHMQRVSYSTRKPTSFCTGTTLFPCSHDRLLELQWRRTWLWGCTASVITLFYDSNRDLGTLAILY